MFARLDLGKKLILLFLLMGVVPTLVASLLAYRESSSALETQSFNQLVAIRDIKKDQITDYFHFIEGQIVTLAANPTTVDALTELEEGYDAIGADTARRLYITDNPHPAGEKLKLDAAHDGSAFSKAHSRFHSVFRQFLTTFDYYDIFIVDDKGDVVYTVFKEDDFGTNLANGKYSKENIADAYRAASTSPAGKATLVDFVPYAPSAGAPASFIATPIFDHDGARHGVLIFQMPIGRINAIMQQRSGMGETGESYLVGSDNLMRSDSFLDPTNHTVTASFANPTLGSVTSDAAKAALRGDTGSEIVIDYNGNPVLSAYTPLGLLGMHWALLAEIDEAEAFASVVSLQWQVGGVMIVTIIVIALIGFFTARSVSSPILYIIGELTDGSAAITSAASQISSSSQSLAEGATEQASALEESSAALEQISAQTIGNAASAVKANAVAAEATSAADGGSHSVEQMIVAMREINTSSSEISKIIKVIEEIAFQTNLLALNAAVEAARAGEHGKGFAVVAEEVRNLAQRAASAAKDTSGLIASAVCKAANGAETADEAGAALKRIVGRIAEVSTLVGEIATASQEQTTGVEQVNKAVSEMDKVTQNNASVAEEAAASAEELNAQAESVNEIVQRLDVVINGAKAEVNKVSRPAPHARRLVTGRAAHA